MHLCGMPLHPPISEKKISFAQSIDGKLADLFILKNKNGLQAGISNYGARWISMLVPDQNGNSINIVAGFDTIDAYMNPSAAYYGATIGRYANRIANGTFILENKEYRLATNNGSNHLHGGNKGFHNVVWDVAAINRNSLLLKYFSPDEEEGYPGNLEVFVRYTLTDTDELKIEFTASTDKPTIINLANHAYFNLNGAGNGDILNHIIHINADRYTPINKNLIPTGSMDAVQNTPFDFREPVSPGSRINDTDPQLIYGNGYDHSFVLNKEEDSLGIAATAKGDLTGIKMEVRTTEPALHLYTGNFMDGSNILSNGSVDTFRTAFCMETQHFPDSPNNKNFPSTILMPGIVYQSITVFRFSN
jgi:aldose 1-epimerase